jgi:V/A-type H+/Na+-transporting ATPase subunit I
MKARERGGHPNPTAMSRVAIVAPTSSLRDALVRVADAGTVELERISPAADVAPSEASQRLLHLKPDVPRLAPGEPDLTALERAGRADLLAGEAEVASYVSDAVVRGEVGAVLGWTPSSELPQLSKRLADVGASVARLPLPRGALPPTPPIPGAVRTSFAPLVRTYATVPYGDFDPTLLAGLAYLVMFGAMFGDVGQGALVVVGALLLRLGRASRFAKLRPYWRFIAGAGISSMVFGLLYGECFGPTGLVPTAWLAPMDHPVQLLLAGIGLGTVLLGGAYAIGTVNRVREGGWSRALYAPSGIAGSALFFAAGLAIASWRFGAAWLAVAAGALALAGLGLAFAGLLSAAGGGGSGAAQAAVELFDLVIRLGANVVSFARLAAFGLTHAVIGWIVWSATVGLWHRGALAAVAAVIVFVLGNAVALTLEALVAAVQALRLEYYELFSRVFEREGRPFQPWHIPIERPVAAPESTRSTDGSAMLAVPHVHAVWERESS